MRRHIHVLQAITEIPNQQTIHVPAAHTLSTVFQKADREGEAKPSIKRRKISVG